MKPTKKNNFFTFIFSFLPGAAEMYMGFMKNGFSILAIFMGACALCVAGADFMMPIVFLIWCYGFFHARNVAKLDDASFAAFDDAYVWEEFDTKRAINVPADKLRIGAAIVLIFVGLGIIWNYVSEIIIKLIPNEYWDYLYPIIYNIPSVVIAIALIAFGVMLISGKKKELAIPKNAADVVATEVFVAKDVKTDAEKESSEAKEA